MGIEFISMSPEDRPRLNDQLHQLLSTWPPDFAFSALFISLSYSPVEIEEYSRFLGLLPASEDCLLF